MLNTGNPGSGKTEIIVHLVKMFAEMGKTVVIVAHTNQAVDNILLKLLNHNIRFMRIGNVSRMNEAIRLHSEDALTENCESTHELEQLYSSFNIFAGTCISMNSHLIFDFKVIEYCVVDEASQLILPENLIPLFNSKKFILVGDPAQLAPVIISQEAKNAGLDQTLFELLMNKDNCIELTIQYRMNSEIMRIANACTYNNQLTCGSQEIANATLNLNDCVKLIDSDNEIEFDTNERWLETCLSKQIDLSVIFLNTDSREEEAVHRFDGNGEVYNEFEINILIKILKYLIDQNYPSNKIGIISWYQRQVKKIRSFTRMFKNVEVSTIDQYQGRDKDIILISCVKNAKNLNVEKSEILNESRRLNVAQTRAKKKLIVIGSKNTLENYEPFKKFFGSLKANQFLKI